MSLKTIGALTVIALSLSACGSSGTSGVMKPNSNTTVEQTEAEKAAAEKAAAEKAAAEKAAAEKAAAEKAAAEKAAAEKAAAEKAAAEKAAAEKAEAERIATEKAEAERIAAEKAEAERIAAEKVEAERIAAEKAEAERIAAEKAEAERIAAEKAEAERIAAEKAEAERIAAEKAEAERIAAEKAEAERIAAEKAEAERIAAEKAEAERIAAEKAEAERIAAEKTEAERIAAEKAEAERIAAEKAEAERIAAEKAEAERIAAEKAEAERIAAEKAEAERIAAEKAQKDALSKVAENAGLSKEKAVQFAENNWNRSEQEKTASLEQAVFSHKLETAKTLIVPTAGHGHMNGNSSNVEIHGSTSGKTLSLDLADGMNIKNGGSTPTGESSACINWRCTTLIAGVDSNYTTKIYNQKYSVVGGLNIDKYNDNGNVIVNHSEFQIFAAQGLATENVALPTLGKATYTGVAFDKENQGELEYTINFDRRRGSGVIRNLSSYLSNISLDAGDLKQVNLSGNHSSVLGVSSTVRTGNMLMSDMYGNPVVEADGTYTVGLFGLKAEEIAGRAVYSHYENADYTEIGFAGKRGEVAEMDAEQKTHFDKLVQTVQAYGLNGVQAADFADKYLVSDAAELQSELKRLALQYGLAKAEEAQEQMDLYPVVNFNQYYADNSRLHWVNPNFTTVNDKGETTSFVGSREIYKLPFSVVVGTAVSRDIRDDIDLSPENPKVDYQIAGYVTPESALPSVGSALYIGKAMTLPYDATFSYTVNFDKRTGSGKIVGLDTFGIITLTEGNIAKISLQGKDVVGIESAAIAAKSDSSDGRYTLGFFGSEAQEVTGIAKISNKWGANETIGFGGQRGEIIK
jgi:hypothetical protein